MSFSNEFICDNDKYEKSKIGKLRNEREFIQAKTYKNWINSILVQARTGIDDIYTDLANGEKLILLLELITGEKIFQPNKGSMVLHKIENVSECLKFIRSKNVYLESIGPEDIVQSNRRLTLGLIWTIILRFQLSRHLDFQEYDLKLIKDSLLLWCQSKTKDFKQAKIKNFVKSWQNGWAFVALIHSLQPDLVNEKDLKKLRQVDLLQWAFDTANQHLYIPKILDAADVVKSPDENSILTYVSYFYNLYTRSKNAETSAKRLKYALNQVSEIECLKDSYIDMMRELLDWIHEKTTHFEQVVDMQRAQEEMLNFNRYFFNERSVKLQVRNECENRYFEMVRLQKLVSERTVDVGQGLSLKDLERAWLHLEHVETTYQARLKEIIRKQDRLSKLSEMFDIKSSKFETYVARKLELLNAMFRFPKSKSIEELEIHLKQSELFCYDILSNQVKFNSLISIADELIDNQYNDYQFYIFFKTHFMSKLKSLHDLSTYNQKTINETRRILCLKKQLENLIEELLQLRSRVESISPTDLTSAHKIIFALEHLKQITNDVNILEEIYSKTKISEPLPEHCYMFVEKSVIDQVQNQLLSLLAQTKDLMLAKKKTLQLNLSMLEFMDELGYIETFLEEKQSVSQTNPTEIITNCNILYLQRRNNLIKLEIKTMEEELYTTLGKGFQLMRSYEPKSKEIETCIDRVKAKWKQTIQLINDRTFLLNDTSVLFDLNQELAQLDLLVLDPDSEPHIRVQTLSALSSRIEHDLLCFKEIIKKMSRLSIIVEKYQNTNQQTVFNDNTYLVYLKSSTVNPSQLKPSHNYLLIHLDNPHIKLISPQVLRSNLLKLFVNHLAHIKSVISSTEFDFNAIHLRGLLSNSAGNTTDHHVAHTIATGPHKFEDISAMYDMFFAQNTSTEVGKLLHERRSAFVSDMTSMSELIALIKQSLHLIQLLQIIIERKNPQDNNHYSATSQPPTIEHPLTQTSNLSLPESYTTSNKEKQLIFIHKMKYSFETLLRISNSSTTGLELKMRFMKEQMERQMEQIKKHLELNSPTEDIDRIQSQLSHFIKGNNMNMTIVQQMNWLKDQHQLLSEHLETVNTLMKLAACKEDNDGKMCKTALRRLKLTLASLQQQHANLLCEKSSIESTNNEKITQYYQALLHTFSKTERTVQIWQTRFVKKLTLVQIHKMNHNLEHFPYYIKTQPGHPLKIKSAEIDTNNQMEAREHVTPKNEWSLAEELLTNMELILFEARHGYENVTAKYTHVTQQANVIMHLQDELYQKKFAKLQEQIARELLRNKQRCEIESFEKAAKEFEEECLQNIDRIEMTMATCEDSSSELTSYRQTMVRLNLAYRIIRNEYNKSKSSEILSKLACLQSLLQKFVLKVENFKLLIQQYESLNSIESELLKLRTRLSFNQSDIDAMNEIMRSLEHVNNKVNPRSKLLVKKLNTLRNKTSDSLFTMKQKSIQAEIEIKLQHLKRIDSGERWSLLVHSIETQLEKLLSNAPVSSTADQNRSEEVLQSWQLISKKLSSIHDQIYTFSTESSPVYDTENVQNEDIEFEFESKKHICNKNLKEANMELEVNSAEESDFTVPTLTLNELTGDQEEEQNMRKDASSNMELGNRDSALFDSSIFFDSFHSSNDFISQLASSQESVANHFTSSSLSLYFSGSDSGNCDINSDQYTPPSSITPESRLDSFPPMSTATNFFNPRIRTAISDIPPSIACFSNSSQEGPQESFWLSGTCLTKQNHENFKIIFANDEVNRNRESQIQNESILFREESKLQLHSETYKPEESHVLCYFEGQVNMVNNRIEQVCNQILEFVKVEPSRNVELVAMLESLQNKHKVRYQNCMDCSIKNYPSIAQIVQPNPKFELSIDFHNIQRIMPHADKLHILNAKLSELGLELNNVERIITWSLQEKQNNLRETSNNFLDHVGDKPFLKQEDEHIDEVPIFNLDAVGDRLQAIQTQLNNSIQALLRNQDEAIISDFNNFKSFIYKPNTTLGDILSEKNEKTIDSLSDRLNKLEKLIKGATDQLASSALIEWENSSCGNSTSAAELFKGDDCQSEPPESSIISSYLMLTKFSSKTHKTNDQFDEISPYMQKLTQNGPNQSVVDDQSNYEYKQHPMSIVEYSGAEFGITKIDSARKMINDSQPDDVTDHVHPIYQQIDEQDQTNRDYGGQEPSEYYKAAFTSASLDRSEINAKVHFEIDYDKESTQVWWMNNSENAFLEYNATDHISEGALNLVGDRLHSIQCQLDRLTQMLLDCDKVIHHFDKTTLYAPKNAFEASLGRPAEMIDSLPNRLAKLQSLLKNSTDQLILRVHSGWNKTPSKNVTKTWKEIDKKNDLQLELPALECSKIDQFVIFDSPVQCYYEYNENQRNNNLSNLHTQLDGKQSFDSARQVSGDHHSSHELQSTHDVCEQPEKKQDMSSIESLNHQTMCNRFDSNEESSSNLDCSESRKGLTPEAEVSPSKEITMCTTSVASISMVPFNVSERESINEIENISSSIDGEVIFDWMQNRIGTVQSQTETLKQIESLVQPESFIKSKLDYEYNENQHNNTLSNLNTQFDVKQNFDPGNKAYEDTHCSDELQCAHHVSVKSCLSCYMSLNNQTKSDRFNCNKKNSNNLNYSKSSEILTPESELFQNKESIPCSTLIRSTSTASSIVSSENDSSSIDGEVILDWLQNRIETVQCQAKSLKQQIESLALPESFIKSKLDYEYAENQHDNTLSNLNIQLDAKENFDSENKAYEDTHYSDELQCTHYVCEKPEEKQDISNIESLNHQTMSDRFDSNKKNANNLDYSKSSEILTPESELSPSKENILCSTSIASISTASFIVSESENGSSSIDGEVNLDWLQNRIDTVQCQPKALKQQNEPLVQPESCIKSKLNYPLKKMDAMFFDHNVDSIDGAHSHQVVREHKTTSQFEDIQQHEQESIRQNHSAHELIQGIEESNKARGTKKNLADVQASASVFYALAQDPKSNSSLFLTYPEKTNTSMQTETIPEFLNNTIQGGKQNKTLVEVSAHTKTQNQSELDKNLQTNPFFDKTFKQAKEVIGDRQIAREPTESKLLEGINFNTESEKQSEISGNDINVSHKKNKDVICDSMREESTDPSIIKTLDDRHNQNFQVQFLANADLSPSNMHLNQNIPNLGLKIETKFSEMDETKDQSQDKIKSSIDILMSKTEQKYQTKMTDRTELELTSTLNNSNNLSTEMATSIDLISESVIPEISNLETLHKLISSKDDSWIDDRDTDETSDTTEIYNLEPLQSRVDVLQNQTDILLRQISTLTGIESSFKANSSLTSNESIAYSKDSIESYSLDSIKWKSNGKSSLSQAAEEKMKHNSMKHGNGFSKISIGSLDTITQSKNQSITTTGIEKQQDGKLIFKENSAEIRGDLFKKQNSKSRDSCENLTFEQQNNFTLKVSSSVSEDNVGESIQSLIQIENNYNQSQVEICSSNNVKHNIRNIELTSIETKSLHTSSNNSPNDKSNEVEVDKLTITKESLLLHDRKLLNINQVDTSIDQQLMDTKIYAKLHSSCLNETTTEHSNFYPSILQADESQNKKSNIDNTIINSEIYNSNNPPNSDSKPCVEFCEKSNLIQIETTISKESIDQSHNEERSINNQFASFKSNMDANSIFQTYTHDSVRNQIPFVERENVYENDGIYCPPHSPCISKRESSLEITKINTTRHFSFNEQSSGTDFSQRHFSAYTASSSDVSDISNQVENSNINMIAQLKANDEASINNCALEELTKNNHSLNESSLIDSIQIKQKNVLIEELLNQVTAQTGSPIDAFHERGDALETLVATNQQNRDNEQEFCNNEEILLEKSFLNNDDKQKESRSENEQQNDVSDKNGDASSGSFLDSNNNNPMQVKEKSENTNKWKKFCENVKSSENKCHLIKDSELFLTRSNNKKTAIFSLAQEVSPQNIVVSDTTQVAQEKLSIFEGRERSDETQQTLKAQCDTHTTKWSTQLQDFQVTISNKEKVKLENLTNPNSTDESQRDVCLQSKNVLETNNMDSHSSTGEFENDSKSDSITRFNPVIYRGEEELIVEIFKDSQYEETEDELSNLGLSSSNLLKTDHSDNHPASKSTIELNEMIRESEEEIMSKITDNQQSTEVHSDIRVKNSFQSTNEYSIDEGDSDSMITILNTTIYGDKEKLNFETFKDSQSKETVDELKDFDLQSSNMLKTDNSSQYLKIESHTQLDLINIDKSEGARLENYVTLQSRELRKDVNTCLQERKCLTSDIKISDVSNLSSSEPLKKWNPTPPTTLLTDDTNSMLGKQKTKLPFTAIESGSQPLDNYLADKTNSESTSTIDQSIVEFTNTDNFTSKNISSVKRSDLLKTSKCEYQNSPKLIQLDPEDLSLRSNEEVDDSTVQSMQEFKSIDNIDKNDNSFKEVQQTSTSQAFFGVNESNSVPDKTNEIQIEDCTPDSIYNSYPKKNEPNISLSFVPTEFEKNKLQENENKSKYVNQCEVNNDDEPNQPIILQSKVLGASEQMKSKATLVELQETSSNPVESFTSTIYSDSSILVNLQPIKKHNSNEVVDVSKVTLTSDLGSKQDQTQTQSSAYDLLDHNLKTQTRLYENSSDLVDLVSVTGAQTPVSGEQHLLSENNSSGVLEDNEVSELTSASFEMNSSLQISCISASTVENSYQQNDIEPLLSVKSQPVSESLQESDNSLNARDRPTTIDSESNMLSRMLRIARYSLPFHLLALCLLVLLLLCPHEEYEFNCLLRKDYASSNIMKVYPNGPPPV